MQRCSAALLLLTGAACHSATDASSDHPGGEDAAAPLRIVTVPATATLTQVGVDIAASMRDSTAFRFTQLLVDSGTAGERDETAAFRPITYPQRSLALVAFSPGPGTHRITVVGVDAAGRPVSGSVVRRFDLPDAPYTATALPDLGNGAGVRWIDGRGVATGWVRAPTGKVQPALWTGNTGRVLQLPDTFDVTALRTNAAGDVLLETTTWSYSLTTGARVLRADGTLIQTGSYFPIAADLTERRLALSAVADPNFATASVIYDVASGRLVNSVGVRLTLLNDAGHGVGTVTLGTGPYPSFALVARGFPTPAMPTGTSAGYCDASGRYTITLPIDLDDADAVLAWHCGALAFLPLGGPAVWADRYVGLGQVHLSRRGGIVAGLDAGGTMFLWRPGSARVSRLRIAGDAWRIDSLAAINASGAIAAHGVERSTGRGAALRLTPVTP